jgi:hypothetical protein
VPTAAAESEPISAIAPEPTPAASGDVPVVAAPRRPRAPRKPAADGPPRARRRRSAPQPPVPPEDLPG